MRGTPEPGEVWLHRERTFTAEIYEVGNASILYMLVRNDGTDPRLVNATLETFMHLYEEDPDLAQMSYEQQADRVAGYYNLRGTRVDLSGGLLTRQELMRLWENLYARPTPRTTGEMDDT